MKIETITFDLDGVYFPDGKTNFIGSIKKIGVSEIDAKRVFLKSDQMNKEYKRGKMTDDDFWRWAIKEWKITLSVKDIIKLMIDGYGVDQKVAEIVKKLRTEGYKTAICSNNFPARINGLQEKFGFLNDFDVKVFSYEVGECKPDKNIFEELVNKSGGVASEVVFADDNKVNLQGAFDVGIIAVEYEGFNKYLIDLRSLGVRI